MEFFNGARSLHSHSHTRLVMLASENTPEKCRRPIHHPYFCLEQPKNWYG